MNPFTATLIGAIAALVALSTHAAEIFALPISGNRGETPQGMQLKDGSTLSNTVFYSSEQSSLSVGRTTINGVLPRETTTYTDVFMVVEGSGVGVGADGATRQIKAGDVVLLPRGLTIQGRDFHGYKHFFASFETQSDATFNGPLVEQDLHPETLTASDYSPIDGQLKHVYYQGRGGVVVEAVRHAELKQSHIERSPDSELMLVVRGTGRIVEDGGVPIRLHARSAILIPKNSSYRLSTSGLLTLTVRFDRAQP